MELSEETLANIEEVIPRYPEKRSAVLMVIHLVQDEQGCISDEAIEWIAEKLDLQDENLGSEQLPIRTLDSSVPLVK